jgi:TRAP-type C4-dicarboxylate transport system substrate-binding protein
LRVELQTAEREAIAEMAARGLAVVDLDGAALAEWEALAESVYPQLACSRQYPDLFERVLRLQREDAALQAD